MLSNTKGKWEVESTPDAVTIHRAYGDLHVSCHKAGCKPVSKVIESTTKPMVFGNAIAGGPIGAGIDVANGAAYSYPETISVKMACQSSKKIKKTSVIAQRFLRVNVKGIA